MKYWKRFVKCRVASLPKVAVVLFSFLFCLQFQATWERGKMRGAIAVCLGLEPYVGSFYGYCDAHALCHHRCSGRCRPAVCELLGEARPNSPSCLLLYVDVSFLASAAAGWHPWQIGRPPLHSVVRGLRSCGNCGRRRRLRVHCGSQVKPS